MRILDEENLERTEADCDLTAGVLLEETIVRPDAQPIDNVTKFAWAEGDFEPILRYVQVPEAQRAAERIARLKQQLADTDYTVIKIAEGAAAPEEYTDVIAQRQAWRAEINGLEGSL